MLFFNQLTTVSLHDPWISSYMPGSFVLPDNLPGNHLLEHSVFVLRIALNYCNEVPWAWWVHFRWYCLDGT